MVARAVTPSVEWASATSGVRPRPDRMRPEPTGEPTKQRSKVSGERGKSRSLKATKRKRSSASNKTPSSASPHASAQAELARLTRELTDERRQRMQPRKSCACSVDRTPTSTIYSTPFWRKPRTFVRPTSEHCLFAKATPSALWRCIMFPLALPSFANASPGPSGSSVAYG